MDFINNNANIFFFVTTIFVAILIIISLFLLYIILKIKKFIQKIIKEGDNIIEKNKDNKIISGLLPIILPLVSIFSKMNKKRK